jgi:hypothetical protein
MTNPVAPLPQSLHVFMCPCVRLHAKRFNDLSLRALKRCAAAINPSAIQRVSVEESVSTVAMPHAVLEAARHDVTGAPK